MFLEIKVFLKWFDGVVNNQNVSMCCFLFNSQYGNISLAVYFLW